MNNQNNNAPVASKNRPFSQDYASPCTFFASKGDASSDCSTEVVDTLLIHARASVIALSASSNLEKGFTLSNEVVLDLLWSIETTINLARTALKHTATANNGGV